MGGWGRRPGLRPIRAVSPAAACSPALSSFYHHHVIIAAAIVIAIIILSHLLSSHFLIFSLFHSLLSFSFSLLIFFMARYLAQSVSKSIPFPSIFPIIEHSSYLSLCIAHSHYPFLSLALIPNVPHTCSFSLSLFLFLSFSTLPSFPNIRYIFYSIFYSLSLSYSRPRAHPFVPYEKDCKPNTQ